MRPTRTRDERRARAAAQETDRRRIVQLLSESRVWMSCAEVAAIIWGPDAHHKRASYHLEALLKEGRVRKLKRSDRKWVGWKA